MKYAHLYIVILSLLLSIKIFPQDVDINPYLKQIESGNKKDVEEQLPSLISKNPNSASVLFLEGVLRRRKSISHFFKIIG